MKKYFIAVLAISMAFTSCKKEESTTTTTTETVITTDPSSSDEIGEALKEFGPSTEVFTESSESTITITTESGTKITFPKDAFVDEFGTKITGDVEISIKEISSVTDMILAGYSSYSEDGILETSSIVEIVVTKDGKELKLAPDVSFSITPSDETEEETEGFYWEVGMKADGTEDHEKGEWVSTGIARKTSCEKVKEHLNAIENYESLSADELWKNIKAIKEIVLPFIRERIDTLDHHGSVGYTEGDIDLSENRFEIHYRDYKLRIHGMDNWWRIGETVIGKGNEFMSTYNPTGAGPESIDDGTDNIFEISTSGCYLTLFWGVVPEFVFGSVSINENHISLGYQTISKCAMAKIRRYSEYVSNCKFTTDIPKHAYVRCLLEGNKSNIKFDLKSDDKFYAPILPKDIKTTAIVYFKDGDKIMFGSQIIDAASEMEFDLSDLKALNNVYELAEEIKKLED